MGLVILMGMFALLFLAVFVLSGIFWFKVDYGDTAIEKFIMVILLSAMSMLSGAAAFGLVIDIIGIVK